MKNRLEMLKNSIVKEISEKREMNKSLFDTKFNFPLVVEAPNYGFNLEKWVEENLEEFEEDLINYGALLFRGFDINTVEKFQSLMKVFPENLLDYKFRSSPRFELVNNVYVSTTYPEDEIINMHSESSYAPNHPGRIVFCCITPSLTGGETPIADNRLIISYLSDELKEKFMQKGVMYRRNLSGILGLSWQEVFQTSDKREVESECEESGMDYTWNGDSLVLKWTKDAIWQHPKTDETVWFNHGLFFNKFMMDENTLNSVNSDDELPNNTFFGDETPITREEIDEIKAAYDKATNRFLWQKGDVLFLDNMLMSHGRNSYKGDRKIIVSIS